MDASTASERVRALFAELLAAAELGAVDAEPFLERAGAERGELAELCATLSSLTPPEPIAFGRFRILATIQSGGQGKVYLAHDPELGRRVALKVLEDTRLDRLEREWVLNEARSIARLEHPGIVRIFDVGQEGGRAFIVMEHLAGPSLADVLRALRGELAPDDRLRTLVERQRSVAARLELLIRLGEALTFCHERGVLHRDVTPANILHGEDGEPRFIDFGLAHTDDGSREGLLITQRLIGTPGYIAPEQLDHQRTGCDPRSDQFAFGVVCYQLLTKEPPFPGDTVTRINRQVLGSAPRRPRSIDPSIPASLERVVLHALEKDPDDRYPTLAQMTADLCAVRDLRPVSVEAPGVARRARLWARRNGARLLAAGGFLALLLGSWLALRLAEDASRRAELRARLAQLPVQSTSPLDLTRAVQDAASLAAPAAELDRSWTALFSASLGPEVRRHEQQLAEQTFDAYEEARRSCSEHGSRFQSDDWSALSILLRPIAPQVWERMDHRRLILQPAQDPSRVQLLEQILDDRVGKGTDERVYLSGYRAYVPVPPVERPAAGAYRLQVRRATGGLLFEADFRVADGTLEPVIVTLRAPDAQVRARALAIPRSVLSLPERIEGTEPIVTREVTVEAFRLGALVSRAELERYAATVGMNAQQVARELGPQPPAGGPHSPAWPSAPTAAAYCAWAGGRLPMATELLAAHASGALPIGGKDRRGHGEWVSDLALEASAKQGTLLKYDKVIEYLGLAPTSMYSGITHGIPELGIGPKEELREGDATCWVGVGFRVAFGDP